MTTTMQLIAKQTVGSGGAASVTFSNIPQTYTDLKVVISTRSSGTSGVQIQFNGSTSNRSNIRLYGNGSVTASYSGSDVFTYQNRSSYTANTFDSSEIYIPNYTSSNYKSLSIDNVTETNASAIDMQLQAGLWSQTAAITSLGFVPDSSQTFVENSTFYLYGISNSTTTQAATVPYASGGDVITTDGSYWYHTFLYSGTFTPLKNLTCDYLVVAGGGGGGSGGDAGGGGAGGLRSTVTATGGGGSLESPLSLISGTTYVTTVGAGGAASAFTSQVQGYSGSNSVFASITSIGGGGGGNEYTGQPATGSGANGGSGGGAANKWVLGDFTGGSGTSGQGYAGGTSNVDNDNSGAGGGGAGAVGGNGSPGLGGNGGTGVAVSISGSSIYYAGGGAGGSRNTPGTGGTGGGGNGGSGAGGNGTVNRGGGGGGTGNATAGSSGAGGSGIVIVRYAV